MIALYRILFIPLFILCLPVYLRRMLKRGGYQTGFWQRFGFFPKLPPKQAANPRIWIQAVSVGELDSISQLLEGFLAHHYEIVLTTTTSSAFTLARQRYTNKILAVGIFPLDFWLCSALSWRRIQPDRVLHVDSELWPEHLQQAKNRQIPLDLCNARISDRSFKRYTHLPFISNWLFSKIRLLLAATPRDQERFLSLGHPPSRTLCTGNLKLDQSFGEALDETAKRSMLIEQGLLSVGEEKLPQVLLGSSTWAGEEALLIEVLQKAIEQHIHLRLLIVPRHPERRKEIKELLKSIGLSYHFRSEGPQAPQGTLIYVADTIGELNRLSALASVIFIGKTLPPHVGGQSPASAAYFGIPMVLGPQSSNFQAIVESLLAHGGALQKKDAREVKESLIALLKDKTKQKSLSEAARSWYKIHEGATKRTLEALTST